MSLPIRNETHVADGLASLISQYKGQPNITGVLTAFLNRVQEVEDVLWNVIDAGLLSTPPTGIWLDQLGDLVGQTRGGLTDGQYLVFVKAAIVARRSGGRPEDVLAVLAIALAGQPSQNANYQEFYPAAFEVWAFDIEADFVIPIALLLGIARALGVHGVFNWSSWSQLVGGTTNQWFYLGDSTGGGIAGSGLKDGVSGNFACALPSSIEV